MQQHLIPYTKEQLQNDLTLIEGVDVGNIEIVPLLLPLEIQKYLSLVADSQKKRGGVQGEDS